jgi:hypothetical protein
MKIEPSFLCFLLPEAGNCLFQAGPEKTQAKVGRHINRQTRAALRFIKLKEAKVKKTKE